MLKTKELAKTIKHYIKMQILETKVSVKLSRSHFLTTLVLNSLFTRL